MSIFTDHPIARGMTYFQHFLVAIKLSYILGRGSLEMLIHAVFPFVLEEAATNTATNLGIVLNKPTSSKTHN